jgi:hypothetical protein
LVLIIFVHPVIGVLGWVMFKGQADLD